jgi:peptidoglycan/xylan/chitin deacetylase (PgdA/CDA1 family)
VSDRATVLAYHAIGDCDRASDVHNLFVPASTFARQMEFLAKRRRVVDLDQAVSGGWEPGPPAVAITFDDGYRNVLEHAAPVLERHGFPATVFVPTAYLGGRNDWIEPTECDVDIMSAAELEKGEELVLHMESHGHAHIDYSKAATQEMHDDLVASLDAIESIVGRRPKHLAYPYGAHSDAARAIARDLNLRAAYTIDEPHAGDYAYERVQITPLDGKSLFALKTSGRYMRLRHARAAKAVYGKVKPLVRNMLNRRR